MSASATDGLGQTGSARPPSPQFSVTLRVRLAHEPDALPRLVSVVGAHGGLVGAVDIVEASPDWVVRDINVFVGALDQADAIATG